MLLEEMGVEVEELILESFRERVEGGEEAEEEVVVEELRRKDEGEAIELEWEWEGVENEDAIEVRRPDEDVEAGFLRAGLSGLE